MEDQMKKIQIGIRFPEDVKRFIDQEAARNCSSANSEVIRAIRERMDRIGERSDADERASA
ncbi:DNA-binding protein [Maritimibacter fusiformis]|uniref:DNA-binding protein n=2 Tax=Maritimibacter fusiformis TaxID=2603819 RepID=A0A5D0RJF3_9RHOB|nr:DNA-binding protein [Maritimibacter fusiformis]